MAGERPTNDWRHQRRPSATGNRPGKRPPSSRKFRGQIAVVLAVLSAGAIAGLLMWRKDDPKPLFVAIAVTDYEEVRGWPINGFALQDADALRGRFPDDGVQPLQSQEGETILSEIKRLGERARKENRVAVLYLSMFGVATGVDVALIPAKADPRDPATWLPLERVIETARSITTPLLFILEVRPVDDPRHGFLGEECRAKLNDQLTRIAANKELMPFDLLVSCSPPEPPYFCPELKRGAFAFVVEEGLRGRADGWNPARQTDGDVTTGELTAFTQARVRQWDEAMRTPHFPPMKYGHGKEFRLVSLVGKPAPPPAFESSGPEPVWLTAGWADIDQWRSRNAHRDSPRAFADYRRTMARAELRLLGGVPSQQIEPDITPKIRDWQTRMKADAAAGPPVWSLAQIARSPDPKLAAEAEKALLPVVRKLRQFPAAKSEEIDAVAKPLTEKEVTQAWLDAAALHLFNVLLTQPDPKTDYTATQLRDAVALISSFRVAPETPKPLPAEWIVMRFLSEADPEIRSLWDAGTLPIMLRATMAMEEAIVADPRSGGKIEPLLRSADADFQTHFVTMFKSGQKNRETALGELKRLADDYRKIRLLADADAFARREWDETASVLQVLADTPALNPVLQPEAERVWSDLLAVFRDVRAKIVGSSDAGELSRTAGLLRDHRKTYTGLVIPPPNASLREWRAALRSPVWDAKTRIQMETSVRGLANERIPGGMALVTDGPPPSGNAPATAMPTVGRLDPGYLKRLTALLDTAGSPVRPGGTDIEMAGRIRDANNALRDKYAKATDTDRVTFAWALHPRDIPGDDLSADPAVTIRREAERRWANGLARDRYMAWAGKMELLPHPSAKEFATALRRLANLATATTP
ncbi:hypothetical protein [Zavarzinella formosa]|uniref:hypothetical protein n=1 Tax=Zavarzinella formosa TaxID=360055 RepID=UPI000318705E|nr:hypothetical protein [Zavarzinella formosa]